MRNATATRSDGMTLVEVIVAIGIFATACLAAAHLVVWAMRTVQKTGASTVALAAAAAKLEELHALDWRFDQSGARVSDPGLAISPPDALLRNAPGFADYLDHDGRTTSPGPDPPAGAAYVRRWALQPLAASAEDTLVIQVLVAPITEVASPSDRAATGGASALLTTARRRIR